MAGSLPPKGRISLPARRLSVRKIKEVLRLKFDVGLGLRTNRLVHNAHRIEMRGDSMRKNRGKPNA